MCPILRGEALPLPAQELRELRERLPREYADAVVPGGSGPLFVIRVPHREPDFLRDLEAAADVLPYRDLRGFRGVLLVGDRAHMGVSCDMLRALLEGREQAERDWVKTQRSTLEPWAFHVGRMPSDPQRRLRAVFRVDVESVEDLDEPDFDRLADMLPTVKASSPGQSRPMRAYIVADVDHAALDGGQFFSELERRRRRRIEREEERHRADVNERHDLAIAHLERILEKRGEQRSSEREELRRSIAPPPAPRRTTAAPARPETLPPVDVLPSRPQADAAPSYPVATSASASTPVAPAAPVAPPPPQVDLFEAAARHPESVAILRESLTQAGYKVKEQLVVRGQPIVLAGARLDRYPTRVLVAFFRTLNAEDARELLLTGRGVGAELILGVAEDTGEGVDRVTLATNLKVIHPDAVPDLSFR